MTAPRKARPEGGKESAPEPKRIAVFEPYYGGSHKRFLDVLIAHSPHDYKLFTLPARKWKWRMRGAAVWFAREEAPKLLDDGGGADVDLIFTCDMLSVADLRALLPPPLAKLPIVTYFHENQLTYPLSPDDRRDYQYGMTNITTCLASDAVWFNSHHHMNAFLSAAEELLRMMPDFVPPRVIEDIRAKSSVFYPPVDVTIDDDDPREPPPAGSCASASAERAATTTGSGTFGQKGGRPGDVERPLRILWPHRWEYDKNPKDFFDCMLRLHREGAAFELVLVGEQFRTAPPEFAAAIDELSGHIVHAGYLQSRSDYLRMVKSCDVVVSTAIQENFGIAIVEAIMLGCFPLLPNRLSYPELIPPELHTRVLYESPEELVQRLTRYDPSGGREVGKTLRERASRFSTCAGAQAIDDALRAARLA